MGRQTSFYEQLLQLPLFQGISRTDFIEIAEKIKISFFKATHEQVIAKNDELCSELVFILHGETYISKTSFEHDYSFIEIYNQPMVVQPEALFGLSNRYNRNYRVRTGAEYIKIEKNYIRDFLFNYPTFRINFLNTISTQVQQSIRLLSRPIASDINNRFKFFVLKHCLRPAGYKEVHIKMEKLSEELLETRLNTSKMLHFFEGKELIKLERGKITIPHAELLFQ